ncbi:MAG: DUF4180 domain-containing protein [Devosia sp.]
MATQSINGVTVYFVSAEGPALASEQDALDLLGETYGTETDLIAVPAVRFADGFFDLSTKQLGHFFQKLQNYQMRLAVLGDISQHLNQSKALRDFVGETNQVGRHLFAEDRKALEAGLRGRA